MPGTAAFLSAWRDLSVRRVLMAKIELTSPSLRTLYLSTEGMIDNAGITWEQAIGAGCSVDAPGSYFESSCAPCSAQLPLMNVALGFQAPGDTIHNLFADFVWRGAAITLFRWVPDKGLVDADRFQNFEGVVDSVDHTRTTALLNLVESRSWRRRIPDRAITDSGVTPATMVGKARPVIYGNHRAPPMKNPPWDGSWTDRPKYEDAGGALLTLPCLVLDKGTGANAGELLIAGHQLWSIPDSEFA